MPNLGVVARFWRALSILGKIQSFWEKSLILRRVTHFQKEQFGTASFGSMSLILGQNFWRIQLLLE